MSWVRSGVSFWDISGVSFWDRSGVMSGVNSSVKSCFTSEVKTAVTFCVMSWSCLQCRCFNDRFFLEGNVCFILKGPTSSISQV
jgi:hypothetical protein